MSFLVRDKCKKLIVSSIIKWVPPLLIIYVFFKFFVSVSLKMREMNIVLNGEDPNSILTWVGQGGVTDDIMVESLSTQTNVV
jgi:hypothetical protein